jgi:hypothetical protein
MVFSANYIFSIYLELMENANTNREWIELVASFSQSHPKMQSETGHGMPNSMLDLEGTGWRRRNCPSKGNENPVRHKDAENSPKCPDRVAFGIGWQFGNGMTLIGAENEGNWGGMGQGMDLKDQFDPIHWSDGTFWDGSGQNACGHSLHNLMVEIAELLLGGCWGGGGGLGWHFNGIFVWGGLNLGTMKLFLMGKKQWMGIGKEDVFSYSFEEGEWRLFLNGWVWVFIWSNGDFLLFSQTQ